MHWKKLVNPDYLGAYSLEQNGTYQNLIVTIESVQVQKVLGTGGAAEDCVVATLVGQKPMILNRTNLKTIERVMKTPDVQQWAGKQIELTVASVKAFGDTVDALRVVPKAPTLPELTREHKHFAAICDALATGKTTLDRLKTKYTFNPEIFNND
jgi:hypothetical protein